MTALGKVADIFHGSSVLTGNHIMGFEIPKFSGGAHPRPP